MGISIFPSTAAEFVSNNFVIDMNNTNNNTADTGGVKQAGPYSMSFSSGDTSFDVYLIDADGNNVGYSNGTSITATGLFDTVVILGVATDEIISFLYQGAILNADGFGDEPGAGAFLTSISPTDLPSIDDTATVVGGNFGADTEITFESGATVLPAKSITVNTSTELLVTRPDGLIEDLAPYTVRAVTTGVPQPTGSNANLLVDAVTAGSDPTFVTTSPLNAAGLGIAFSQTITATDEGDVTFALQSGTITPGLTLASDGTLSGTATTEGNNTFTIRATDDGGNITDKEFEQLVVDKASGGTIVEDGGFRYHTFTSSDDFITAEDLAIEYLIVGGGGSGANNIGSGASGGGGGAGGYIDSSASSGIGSFPVTIGAGGAVVSNGNDTVFGSFGTALGGGNGAQFDSTAAGDGGSGGGGAGNRVGGNALASGAQGSDGGGQTGVSSAGSGGGGATQIGSTGNGSTFVGGKGGNGSDTRSDFATATGLIFDGGFFAGGGGGGGSNGGSSGGLGGGGASATPEGADAIAGEANSGGGGGGPVFGGNLSKPGGSGVLIVRYAI